MDISRDPWIARCATAACVASRWISGASMGLTVLALCHFYFLPAGTALAAAAISLAAVAGAAQVYLAVRIEFDRAIFESLAGAAAGSAGAADGFDRAAQALGLLSSQKAGRDFVRRSAGVLLLVKMAFLVFLSQLALLVAAVWMPG